MSRFPHVFSANPRRWAASGEKNAFIHKHWLDFSLHSEILFFMPNQALQKQHVSTYAVSCWKKIGVRFEHWNKQRSTIILLFTISSTYIVCYCVFETVVCICGSLFVLTVMIISLIANILLSLDVKFVGKKRWAKEKLSNVATDYWFSKSSHGRWKFTKQLWTELILIATS